MTEAYPLKWPDGWPRTASASRKPGNQFGQMQYRNGNSYKSLVKITPGVALKGLTEGLTKLGAKHVTVSSNVRVRQDGMMYAGDADRHYPDPGIAVYFELKGRATVMAQDAYDNIAANLRSLSLAVEAMRALERHGGGTMMSKAFDGFAALPPPAGSKPKRPWWEVLRYSEHAEDREFLSAAEVTARFHTLAKRFHPDAGGDGADMAELSTARDEALAAIEAA